MIDKITEEASENTKTLSMWVVTESALDAGVKKAVNDAVNDITTSKFNTYLFINFLTEDEYYAKVEGEIRAYEDSKSTLAPATEAVAGDPIIVGDNQFAKHYPALRAHQVDIIYISGEDMYAEYVENGWLSSLDSELSASAKKIKEHLSATLLEAAKIDKGIYAIPNNKALGEYTYMLLDKKLMDDTFIAGSYNQGKINGFFNEYIFNYLDTVRYMNETNAEGEEDILPIDASYEYCLDLLAHYWSIDPETYEAQNNQFSILGYRYTDPTTLSKGKTTLSFDSLFADEVFCENFVKLNEYKMDGNYFGKGDRAAIRFVTGDYSDYERYQAEYYPVIVKYPTIDADDVFESMFGICSYSVDLSASMQILTYLNTNADFRNLLQYGVEGEHYKLSEGGKVERIEGEDNKPLYDMDVYKTGNAFVAYPDPSLDEDVWEIAKKQNREVLIDPLLGFDFATLVEKSGASAEEVKIGSSGYVYTYESGYSKEVASQNALLKKWIDACDQAGKGVYVLHTSKLVNTNFVGKIYYYNNHISNAKVSVTDGDGSLIVNYQGTDGDGTDLTVIAYNGRKNTTSALNWRATMNGAEAATAVTYQNSVLNFDFCNTEAYSVDFDANVTKAMVLENDAVWSWIYNTAHDDSKLNLAVYSAPVEGKEGVYKYTYVGYLPTVAKKYTMTMQPTVNGGELILNVNYTTGTESMGETDAKYALFVANVELCAPMTSVKMKFTMDGNAYGEDKTVVTTLDTDPRIAISGTLDVELVKFVNTLSAELDAMLKNCVTIDEFKALVDDLHLLLTPKTVDQIYAAEGVAFDTFATPALNALLENYDAKEFYRALACATTTDKVAHKVLNEKNELKESAKIAEIYSAQYSDVNEFYHYYVSPYALYVNWLKENGYTK